MKGRALLIGLCYKDKNYISGSYNDVELAENILKKNNYKILKITDINRVVNRKDIISSLKWLSKGSNIFIHFSGHRINKEFLLSENQKFNDEDIYNILISNMNENDIMIGIFDCCNGSDMDLKWNITQEGIIRKSTERNINKNIIFISSILTSFPIIKNGKDYGIISYYIYKIINNNNNILLYNIYIKLIYYYNKNLIHFQIPHISIGNLQINYFFYNKNG
jgi:hypothetical protein